MKPTLPLHALLSQVLIAFTIEFDNEFEHRMTQIGARRFWVSMVMWSNFMRHIHEQGISVRELSTRARSTNSSGVPGLSGMQRWGYVSVGPDGAYDQAKTRLQDCIVRPTEVGLKAIGVWQPLSGEIEQRWRNRFGGNAIEELRTLLCSVICQVGIETPRYLPILGYGLSAAAQEYSAKKQPQCNDVSLANLDLSVLLAQTLLAVTVEYESESSLSLAISADVVRVLDERGVRVRDLPRLSGVSKEAISMALGFLAKRGCVTVAPDPDEPRTKRARLEPKGTKALEAYNSLVALIEERWKVRCGVNSYLALSQSLQSFIDRTNGDSPLLSEGLKPYPTGWRASQPYLTQTNAILTSPADALPHYPMVLHRGGWPDGS